MKTRITKIVWSPESTLDLYFDNEPIPHSPTGYRYDSATAALLRVLDEQINVTVDAIEEIQNREVDPREGAGD